MAGLAKRLDALGLRPTEATVLNAIDANPSSTQSDIGRLLTIARANMAPLVSRLEARDLIERKAVNGRSHGLILTARGRALALKVKKTVDDFEQVLLERIPASHREAFVRGLRSLARARLD